MIEVGIIMFLAVVIFQVITLPVEFNISRRVLIQLEDRISPTDKIKPSRNMLKDAAFTYVASTLVAIGELLRLLVLTSNR